MAESAVNHLLQLPVFIHLHHDVGAADEFAFDVELGNGWPVAVFLDASADFWIVEHIDCSDALGIYADSFQNLDGATREAALRETCVAFHEKYDIVTFHEAIDFGLGIAHF
jgi:hypothetical protein